MQLDAAFDPVALKQRLDASTFAAHSIRGALTYGVLTSAALSIALVVGGIAALVFASISVIASFSIILGSFAVYCTIACFMSNQSKLSLFCNVAEKIHKSTRILLESYPNVDEVSKKKSLTKINELLPGGSDYIPDILEKDVFKEINMRFVVKLNSVSIYIGSQMSNDGIPVNFPDEDINKKVEDFVSFGVGLNEDLKNVITVYFCGSKV